LPATTKNISILPITPNDTSNGRIVGARTVSDKTTPTQIKAASIFHSTRYRFWRAWESICVTRPSQLPRQRRTRGRVRLRLRQTAQSYYRSRRLMPRLQLTAPLFRQTRRSLRLIRETTPLPLALYWLAKNATAAVALVVGMDTFWN